MTCRTANARCVHPADSVSPNCVPLICYEGTGFNVSVGCLRMNNSGKVQKDPRLDRGVDKRYEMKQKIYNMLFQRIVNDLPVLINEKEQNLKVITSDRIRAFHLDSI